MVLFDLLGIFSIFFLSSLSFDIVSPISPRFSLESVFVIVVDRFESQFRIGELGT